eukprot:1145375-Pelagomonas_calceolata.AAC.4
MKWIAHQWRADGVGCLLMKWAAHQWRADKVGCLFIRWSHGFTLDIHRELFLLDPVGSGDGMVVLMAWSVQQHTAVGGPLLMVH